MEEPQNSEYQEREDRILTAAEKLMLRYGIDKTTVDDIAREAGVAKGTIYLHYKSKDDLFEALIWKNVWIYSDEVITRMESDIGAWSFVNMYRHALAVMAKLPVLQALYRDDTDIMGSFLRRRGERFVTLKNQSSHVIFEAMQKVGAIRSDLDINVLAYLFSIISIGFLHLPELDKAGIPKAPLDDVLVALGEMIEAYLVPPGGGNPEAAHQIMAETISALKTMLETQKV